MADERSLILAGYLAFADPPNPDAAESLAAMKRDGVEVKILTGDNELVARHVCEQVGLVNPTIVLGEELDRTSDPALGASGRRNDGVCARLANAEASDYPRAEASRPCGRLHGRRHQRRALAARRGRRDFRLVGSGRRARSGGHHPAQAGPAMSCTMASSKAAGPRRT